MSETFPRQRALPGNFDVRPREQGGQTADPLAELARLVGRDDPFKDLFANRENRAASRPAHQGAAPPMPRVDVDDIYGRPSADRARPAQSFDYDDHAAPNDDNFDHSLGNTEAEDFSFVQAGDARRGHAHASPASFSEVSPSAPPLNADLWAQGMPEPAPADPLDYAAGEAEAETGSSRGRTFVVLAAVLALTAGGLGATFLVRGGSTMASNGQPPTIMADTGPVKVQPPDTSNQSTGGDGNTALIEKSASDNVANAKVVNTQERPVDLSQLPKAPDNAPAPDDGRVAVTTTATTNGAATSASTAFPEPRKVKTVMIRPDGSVVGESTTAAAGAAPADAVAKPATPKTVARATSTPKAATTPTDAAAKPKPTARPKPAEIAAATPAVEAASAPTTASAGGFAVQLAAPSTEQEAKSIAARLQKKFAGELDGHAPVIRKADDKSVYRVRIANLSQDDARALCTKLQAGGGSCFVVRN